MTALPIRRPQFKTADFLAWLAEQGAEIGTPTNAYEVVRYRAFVAGGHRAATHIVYAKESGLLTFCGSTREHYEAFLAGEEIDAMDAPQGDGTGTTPMMLAGKSRRRKRQLRRRDGGDCWYCGKDLGDDVSIEHLVPRSSGGAHDLANLVLAHVACNRAGGNLSLAEKMALRERMRAAVPA